eukprot:TRINITY_DN7146_c0_g1_i2.p1 TRINITY_DN7146_c0_g1~~TRINITY_DN7146_c0_g1_i2.p1  ORF type:complete len:744 (+),score=195.50 TRINITY_DN7146_c0_g1_i2:78-2309(+)
MDLPSGVGMAVPSKDCQLQVLQGQKRRRQQQQQQQQLDEDIPTLSELRGRFERAVTRVDDRIEALERRAGEVLAAVGDRGRSASSPELHKTVSVLQSRLEGLERGIETRIASMERAGRGEVLKMQKFAAGFGQRIDKLEDERERMSPVPATAALELNDVRQRVELVDAVEAFSAALEQGMRQMASLENVQELRAAMEVLQSNINGVDEDGAAHLQRLEGMFEAAKAERAGVDGQLQDLRSALETSESKGFAAAMTAVEARAVAMEQHVASARESIQRLEASAKTSEDQLKSFTETLQNKVDVEDMRDLVDEIAQVSELQRQLSADIAGREDQGFARLQQLSGTVAGIQGQLSSLAHSADEKASAEQVQSLKSAFSGMQDRLACLQQQSVQDGSGGTKQTQQFREELSELRARMSRCESSAQQKAEARDVQQLREAVTASQTTGRSFGDDRAQHLEVALSTVRREMASLERIVQGKADIGQMPLFGEKSAIGGGSDVNLQAQVQMQQLRSTVTSLERKLADVEQSLEDKAPNAQVAACRRAASNTEAKIGVVENLIHDKADSTQLNQLRGLLSNTQAQVATIEQAVAEKVGPEELQELRGTTIGVRAEVANLEQSLHDKVSTSQAQALRAGITAVETRLAGVEQAIQDKACDGQVQQVRNVLGTLQVKVAGLSARERTEGFAAGSSRLRLPAPLRPPDVHPGGSGGGGGEDRGGYADGGAGRPRWPRIRFPQGALPEGSSAAVG